MQSTILRLLATTLLLFFVFGCSDDDDNPVSNGESPHFDAVGTMLIHGTDTLVTVNGTSVDGEIELHEDDTLGVIDVWFLDPDDNSWYHPESGSSPLDDHDHYLVIEEHDTTLAKVLIGTALPGNSDLWSFGIAGLEAGETSARVKIYHIDHPDYVSPMIDIHVEHEHDHASAVGCMFVMNDDTVVTVDGTVITGEFHVHEGHSPHVAVWFLDPDGDWFQPHADDGYSLALSVANTDVFTATPDTEDPWTFIGNGVEEGETTVTVAIQHGGHADYTSPAIPVHVVHQQHASAAGCKLELGGIDVVTVDGTNITGSLNLTNGQTTDLITVWFLDPDGDWFQPEADDHSLGATPSGANFTVNTDAGDRWQFTAAGSAPGTDELVLQLIHVDHPDYTSPGIPVNIGN